MSQGFPRNFSASEFHCNCDGRYCQGPAPDASAVRHLAWTLQVIRDAVGVPLKINSAYRCPEYNQIVGGAPNSQHKYGTAADLKPIGISPAKLHEEIEHLVNAGDIPPGGLGLYNSFVHYDIRPRRARWNG